MSNRNTSFWNEFFIAANIPPSIASRYAMIFSDNHIQENRIDKLNKDVLANLGIKSIGYIRAILNHAKEIADEGKQSTVMPKNKNSENTKHRMIQPPSTTRITTYKPMIAPPTIRDLHSSKQIPKFKNSTKPQTPAPTNKAIYSTSNTVNKTVNGIGEGNKNEVINKRNELIKSGKNLINSKTSNVSNGINTKKAAAPGTATARAATTLISLQREIDKYKKLSEAQKHQLDDSKNEMSKSLLVVDGLVVVVKYLTEHMNALANPSLCLQIKKQVKCYDELKEEYKSLESFIDQMRMEHCKREEDLKGEIDRMCIEISNEKQRHDKEKTQLFDMFDDQMNTQQKQFEKEVKKLENQRSELESANDQLKNNVELKLQEIQNLTNVIKDLEASLSMEKDRRCRVLQEKVQFMTNEVQSLKDVLELKDNELRSLKIRIATEELKGQELQTAQQTVANLTQRLEQLEAAASQKNAIISELKEENEALKQRYDREQRERRRISMKNEELEFTLHEIVTPNKSTANFSCQVDEEFVTPLKPAPRSRYTMASVPVASRVPGSWRKPRTSMSARKDLCRTNFHSAADSSALDAPSSKYLTEKNAIGHYSSIQPPPASSDSLSPSLESPSTISSEDSNPESSTAYHSASSQVKLTFQDGESNEGNQKALSTEDKSNDPFHSLPPNLPQSILDSGFEDIDGLITLR